jgi:hypothetical protein
MSDQIDKLNKEMPCGHLARYAVNQQDGAQYCAVCLNEQSMCSYCGEIFEGKDKAKKVAEHVVSCERRPEKKLLNILEAIYNAYPTMIKDIMSMVENAEYLKDDTQ